MVVRTLLVLCVSNHVTVLNVSINMITIIIIIIIIILSITNMYSDMVIHLGYR